MTRDDNAGFVDEVDRSVAPETVPKVPEPSVSSGSSRKKSKKSTSELPPELKTMTDVASAATKVLTGIASKKPEVDTRNDDKAWDFCKFLYHKLKAIPEGDLKDELQLDIQRTVCQTKRQCANLKQQTGGPAANVNYAGCGGSTLASYEASYLQGQSTYCPPVMPAVNAQVMQSGSLQEFMQNEPYPVSRDEGTFQRFVNL